MRAEFLAAETEAALRQALRHLANSLHDRHALYFPGVESVVLDAGLELGVSWEDGQPGFVVTRVDGTPVAVGDRLVSFDGYPAQSLLETLALESPSNQRETVAADIAAWLVHPLEGLSRWSVGDAPTWIVERGGEQEVLEIAYGEWGTTDSSLPVPIRRPCEERDFGLPLQARGERWCLFGEEGEVAVVRYASFYYGWWDAQAVPALEADQRALRRALRALAPSGVLLDLRDNGGGNSAEHFLDRWFEAPYRPPRHRYVLLPEALERLQARGGDPPQTSYDLWDAEAYAAELAAEEGPLGPPRPHQRHSRRCAEDTHAPRARRVWEGPLVVASGPGCISSCDSFVRTVSDNGLAPLIGLPPAAAYTSRRFRVDVPTLPGELPLGHISVAFSVAVSGVDGAPIEAVPPALDRVLPPAPGASWDRALVEAAAELLGRGVEPG